MSFELPEQSHANGRFVVHFRLTGELPSRFAKKERGSRMKDVAAKADQTDREQIALHLCYGRIGISAVAAAARYQGDAMNRAYAPVPMKSDAPETAIP